MKNALSYISNGAIPRLKLRASIEEILTRITELEKANRAAAVGAA